MNRAPRLEIDLGKLSHNARTLAVQLGHRGISISGVTKAFLGTADIANEYLRAGIGSLADSRIENLAALRAVNVTTEMMLIRAPMMSQTEAVVSLADVSCNTEVDVLQRLSVAACKAGVTHRVILMVELGDLREGIMPDDLVDVARKTLKLRSLVLDGIGTNLACRSGVCPDAMNMTTLSELAYDVEAEMDYPLNRVSGGNSANLEWALAATTVGRINHLRLGEALLLGREALRRKPLPGLHTDAFKLVAEVIESNVKPSMPSGKTAQNAFGKSPTFVDRGNVLQSILALGQQDTDPDGLEAEQQVNITGASSDHLILESFDMPIPVGTKLSFQPNYSALLRAMTSPFVQKHYWTSEQAETPQHGHLRSVS